MRADVATRRAAIEAAYAAIHEHERGLTEKLIAGVAEIPNARIYGITDPARFDNRCGTRPSELKDTLLCNWPLRSANAASSPGMAIITR